MSRDLTYRLPLLLLLNRWGRSGEERTEGPLSTRKLRKIRRELDMDPEISPCTLRQLIPKPQTLCEPWNRASLHVDCVRLFILFSIQPSILSPNLCRPRYPQTASFHFHYPFSTWKLWVTGRSAAPVESEAATWSA